MTALAIALAIFSSTCQRAAHRHDDPMMGNIGLLLMAIAIGLAVWEAVNV